MIQPDNNSQPLLEEVVSAVSGRLLAGLNRTALVAARAACSHLTEAARAPLAEAVADAAASIPAADMHGDQRRSAALRGLAALCMHTGREEKRVTHLATACLGRSGTEVRCAAAAVLAARAPGTQVACLELAHTRLCAALGDRDPRVGAAAAKALARLLKRGDVTTTRNLCRYMQHGQIFVRQASAALLAEAAPRGHHGAVTELAAAVTTDTDWRVRLAAARALGRIAERGNEVAHKALLGGLRDEHALVRNVSAGAIVHVSPSPSSAFIAAAVAKAGAKEAASTRRRCRQSIAFMLSPPPQRQRHTRVDELFHTTKAGSITM